MPVPNLEMATGRCPRDHNRRSTAEAALGLFVSTIAILRTVNSSAPAAQRWRLENCDQLNPVSTVTRAGRAPGSPGSSRVLRW